MGNQNTPVVGLVGWRGMVGSVLMERMLAEKDFDLIEPVFFSTSQAGGEVPALNGQKVTKSETKLQDANDIAALGRCDIILTCQGGDYTNAIFPALRTSGWQGHWIVTGCKRYCRTWALRHYLDLPGWRLYQCYFPYVTHFWLARPLD